MMDLLMKRRTIRKYTDEEVDQETIDKIIRAALTSPSGRNKRPWELILVQDKEILAHLSKVREGASNHMKDAGLGIVVAADPSLTDVWVEDASIMATIIQLTSQSLGLGSCWIQVRNRFSSNKEDVEVSIKNILNIPENYHVECMISIGYPDEEKQDHDVEKLDYEKVHYNKF